MKISVCWITKNEEANIARAINSMKEYTDELIVVDTGSTDNTVEAARSLGATVVPFEWINDFSAARNYGLSLSTGDILMCPDADMWYDPPFGPAQRKLIENAFRQHSDVEYVSGTIVDVDKDSGVVINEAITTIAFKKSPNIKYFNAIHEQILHLDGSFLTSYHIDSVRIHHSGYSFSMLKEKADRNIAMLKILAQKEEEELGGAHTPLTDFYMMREYNSLQDYDVAAKSFSALHSSSKSVMALLSYPAITSTYFYLGMRIANTRREWFSREDLYENHVLRMKRMLPAYAGSSIIDLNYQILFDLKDDVFLAGFEKVLASFDPKAKNNNSESIRAFAVLCARAARICWQRGNVEKTFDYCVARFKASDVFDGDTFSLLLSCVKGQPDSEIVLFLNSLFDNADPLKAHALAEGLQHDGFQVVFNYYVMKQVEAEIATKKHFLQLLIINRNFKEAVERAVSMEGDSDPNLLESKIFIAIFCAGDRQLYDEYQSHLNNAGRLMMDAFYAGSPVQYESFYDASLLSELFTAIAFLSDVQTAAKFLELFSIIPRICFQVESKYYVENSMFDEALHSRYAIGLENDPAASELMLAVLIKTGRYEDALQRVKNALSGNIPDGTLLNHLLAIAESGHFSVAGEARQLYDKFIYLHDESVDMNDVMRTRKVFDHFKKRDRKRFAEITAEELMAEIAADDKITSNLRHLMAIEQAARVYEEEDVPAMALHCHMRLRACGYRTKRTTEHLAHALARLGNKKLSRQLAEKAAGMEDTPAERPLDAPPAHASAGIPLQASVRRQRPAPRKLN
ncbi:MAG: glycosyltransferase [Clostridiales Family XIII bacterium]|jgi:glycosyltransferase involved in cell wall biosynthesis|nr:glycosyltransferase [Clostridiales Family XIII bacterium]